MPLSESELKGIYGEYLEHSIRYYHLDAPVVGDGYYDELTQILQAQWGDFEHKYKHLTCESALAAGSGFQIRMEDVAGIVWLCRIYPRPLKEVFNERRGISVSSGHTEPEGSRPEAVPSGPEVAGDIAT
jgi:hypothetical protein